MFENLPLQLKAADGCTSSVSAVLTVHDDRPALRLVNSSGGTTSSMAAGASTSGRWGRAIDSTGGFSSAVGADASAYANADFANSVDNPTPKANFQCLKGDDYRGEYCQGENP